MDFFLIPAVILVLVGGKIFPPGKTDPEPFAISKTRAVCGLCTLLVFYRHMGQYLDLDGAHDQIFAAVDSFLRQAIVVPYFFFSGYGITVQILRKGQAYVRSIPRKRVLKIWLHFALAVLLFVLLNRALSIEYDPLETALAFTGWTDVGNSNWYIFTILVLYLMTWLAFRLVRNTEAAAWALALFASLYFTIVYPWTSAQWYSTGAVYPLGVLFAVYGERITEKIRKDSRYAVPGAGAALLAGIGSVLLLGAVAEDWSGWYNLPAALAALCMAFLLYKVSVGNKVLDFLGKYMFEIYILQRLPMIAFSGLGWDPYVYVLASMAATLVLAVIFRVFMDRLDGRIRAFH